MLDYLIVKNNRFVFTSDRAVFIERGIPPSYFDLLLADLEETNNALDRSEREDNWYVDLNDAFEKSKKEMESYRKNAP